MLPDPRDMSFPVKDHKQDPASLAETMALCMQLTLRKLFLPPATSKVSRPRSKDHSDSKCFVNVGLEYSQSPSSFLDESNAFII